jgi:hypothetical protein
MAKHKNSEVKKKTQRVVDLGRLPQGKVTVDDVIEANDINELLAEVQSKRANIDGLLVAWRSTNGTISYRYVKATDVTVVAICEIVKQHCIQRSWLSED